MGVVISGPNTRTLTFRRATLITNPTSRLQTTQWADTVTVKVCAQPGGTKSLSDALADEYTQTWTLIVANPKTDIRTQDRVTIDGAECVVISVNPYGHLEVQCGALRAGPSQ